MKARKLAVEGAWEFTPSVFPDERGFFLSPYQEEAFIETLGHPLFHVAQTNHSKSRQGVVRGIHFTVTPPGTAKYVYCPRGSALDIVIDIRVGSPTFGVVDAVQMEADSFRSMYFPIGVGHAFVALEDNTVMSYMLSSPYVAENELALSALDPSLSLPLPKGLVPVLSARDGVAPTLAQALAMGILPDYETSRKVEDQLYGS